jgi:hypothetical protein
MVISWAVVSVSVARYREALAVRAAVVFVQDGRGGRFLSWAWALRHSASAWRCGPLVESTWRHRRLTMRRTVRA